jgi:hypothetical protein
VSSELDRNVITTCLHDLREEVLYLHHSGRRYRFEPKANLNLVINEERSKCEPQEVLDRVRQELARVLGAVRDRAVLWPPIPAPSPTSPSCMLAVIPITWCCCGPRWRRAHVAAVRGG